MVQNDIDQRESEIQQTMSNRESSEANLPADLENIKSRSQSQLQQDYPTSDSKERAVSQVTQQAFQVGTQDIISGG